MRHKDTQKQRAIIAATIKLVNETGFAAASVSKIAAEAGVSPATLYVYYRNKEDLLVSTYVEIKKDFGRTITEGYDVTLPIRDKLQLFWRNAFKYIKKDPGFFQFSEQFAKTPYAYLVDREDVEKHFAPIFATLRQGIEQKVIKNVPLDILVTFMFHPIMQLSDPKVCTNFDGEPADVDLAFSLAWDAIRL